MNVEQAREVVLTDKELELAENIALTLHRIPLGSRPDHLKTFVTAVFRHIKPSEGDRGEVTSKTESWPPPAILIDLEQRVTTTPLRALFALKLSMGGGDISKVLHSIEKDVNPLAEAYRASVLEEKASKKTPTTPWRNALDSDGAGAGTGTSKKIPSKTPRR